MKGRSRFRFRYRGIMGALAQALGSLFDKILNDEETAGNDNVFYNPQDLTSLRVGTDGSGGSPAVGDPVGMMLDTSGLAGSMEEFLSSQPELVTNGTFDTDTDWSKGTGWSISGGSASYSGGTGFNLSQTLTSTVGNQHILTFDVVSLSGGTLRGFLGYDGSGHVFEVSVPGSYSYTLPLIGNSNLIFQSATGATMTATIDNISVKEIPGNHAIAPSDAARPVLMDDPDTTWSSLTDDGTRGPELITNGTFDTDSDWTKVLGATIANGVASLPGGGGQVNQTASVEIGAEYEVTYTSFNKTGAGSTRISFGGVNGTLRGGEGTYTETIRAISAGNAVVAYLGGSGSDSVDIDNISVRKVNTAFDERGAELSGAEIDGGTYKAYEFEAVSGQTYRVRARISASNDTNHYLAVYNNSAGAGSLILQLAETSGNVVVGQIYESTFTANSTATWHLRAFPNGGTGSSSGLTLDIASVKAEPYPNLLLASNGSDDDSTFDTDTGNWTKGTGWSIGSGVASCDGTNPAQSNLGYPASLEANKWYLIRFYVSSHTTGYVYAIPGNSASATIPANSAGWHEGILRADGISDYLIFTADAGTVLSIDNVIIQELPSTTPTSYYLDTDGTDDWMEVTPTLNLGEQWWHTGAWQSDTSNRRAFATSGVYQGAPRDFGGSWTYLNPAATAWEPIATGTLTVPHVFTVEQNDTNSISGRYNGTQTGPVTPYDDSAQTQGLALFSQWNVSWGAGLNGRFYGGAWGQGQVDYDELTTLQDYLGTLVEPDIDPTDVTSYASVYEMLSAQTAAALFDIDDTTSLRVETDGSGGVPVDGDPVGMMMDVSGTGGGTMAAYLAGAAELVTNGTFDTDTSGWSATASISAVSGRLRIENSGTGYQYAYQSFSTTSGQFYKIDVELFAGTAGNVAVSFINGTPSGPSGGAGSKSFIVQATSSSIQIRITCNVATTSGVYVEADNISVKALPGYVATAPSDAARPTLASVLDETASELTDDGTRGPELVTSSFPLTYTNYSGIVGSMEDAEIGAVYELTYTITDASSVDVLFISESGSPWAYQDVAKTVGTHTYTLRAQDAGNGSVLYVGVSSGSITFSDISVKKVQTVFDGRGDELVTNGDFSDGSTGWSLVNASVSAGVATITANGGYVEQSSIGITAGNSYEITFDIVEINGDTAGVYCGTTSSGNAGAYEGFTTVGTHTVTLTAHTNGDFIKFSKNGTSGDLVVDNISVKEVLTPNLLLTSAGDDDSTFDTDTGNYTLGTGWSITGGELVATGVSNGVYARGATISIDGGKWYKVQFYVPSYTAGGVSVRFSDATANETILGEVSSTGWHTLYGLTLAGHDQVDFRAVGSTTMDIDNVIVQEVPASVARAFYLDFDGVDDNLILDGTDFGSSTNATLYKTFRGDTTDTAQIMFGSNGGPYILAANSGSASTTLNSALGSPVYREDGTIPSYATRGDIFTALVDDTDHTIGVEEADLSANALWTSGGFYIGQELDATWNSTGRLYSWAAVDTRLDGRNRDLLENFMISKKTS